ncbi:hypothetical protein [Nostoc sp. 106C]|uniref:hypothetical protein n=1 Tax=Nostoc sp. 106C TaxID=1932667 RepID=UPI00117D8CCF|nr:hypothetical protein [Nostoc sp. 106C]
MTIQIGNYLFEGPYWDINVLNEQSGVYTIVDCHSNGSSYVLDVGESDSVRTRVQYHNRKACWTRNCRGTLAVAVYYTSELRRMRIEQELRAQYAPVCGIR